MKKLKFLVNVPDKYTGERYEKGQIKEFNNKRAEEILNTKRANGEPYAILLEDEIETESVRTKEQETLKRTRKKKE